jgi:long-chain fatty acid transport protein
MKLKKIAALIAIAGLSTSAFATNGYFAHGYGIKAKGMGGVGIAYGQDALAAATNPANMVLVGNRWDAGVEYFRPQRESSFSAGGATLAKFDGNDSENYFIPEFGYNKMINNNMSLGVSVYGNGGMATDYGTINSTPFAFGVGKAGVDLAQLFIAPTLSYKINDKHSIGLSFKIAYQTFEAFGIQGMCGAFSSNPAKCSNKDHDGSWGWGLGIGWTGKITPTLTLGAVYQSKTSMQNFDNYKGLFAEKGSFDIPESYGLGLAWQATPQFVIAADVQQINYSKIRAIANTNTEGGPLGANNGAGFGWDDMTVFKIGVAYDINKDWTIRAGYNHGSQPIPKSQTMFNILAPGVVEDHLTLGATWRLQNGGEVTFMYMHAFEKQVKGAGSTATPPVEANIKMYQDSLGIAYGAKF